MMEPTTLIAIGFFVLAGICLLCSGLLKPRRRYLPWLAIVFFAQGIGLCKVGKSLWIPLLIALVAFIIAVIEGVRDTRKRLQKWQADERDREQAFAEMMTAVAKKQSDDAGEDTIFPDSQHK